MRILVTGSEGLIGSELTSSLADSGIDVRRFDLKRTADEDIRSINAIRAALAGVDGVVHLAAVSRVVWGENDTVRCRDTNVRALNHLIHEMIATKMRPWLLFASSREVYGEAKSFPVDEDFPLQPLNEYARTKVEGESLVLAAREYIVANICRFSTVYGSTRDHIDRLMPAFASVAARGGTLRVDGSDNFVDCTHVEDVCRGLMTVASMSSDGERLPPIHFVSGVPSRRSLNSVRSKFRRLQKTSDGSTISSRKYPGVRELEGQPGPIRFDGYRDLERSGRELLLQQRPPCRADFQLLTLDADAVGNHSLQHKRTGFRGTDHNISVLGQPAVFMDAFRFPGDTIENFRRSLRPEARPVGICGKQNRDTTGRPRPQKLSIADHRRLQFRTFANLDHGLRMKRPQGKVHLVLGPQMLDPDGIVEPLVPQHFPKRILPILSVGFHQSDLRDSRASDCICCILEWPTKTRVIRKQAGHSGLRQVRWPLPCDRKWSAGYQR